MTQRTLYLPLLFAFLVSSSSPAKDAHELATFAGGCFWCVESAFEGIEGVWDVTSGYTGGENKNPTYDEVGRGITGHAEAIQLKFNPKKISYEKLLDIFWRNIDPTDSGGQFADRGTQYRPAIFYHSEAQKTAALKSKEKLEASKRFQKKIATQIVAASIFYPAEAYHQDYYKTNRTDYKRYRTGSGRDAFLEKTWGHTKYR